MRQQIVRLSVHQTSKVLAVLYALMGLLVVPLLMLSMLVGSESETMGMGFVLLFPVLYGVLGYVFVALGCALYNVVAGRLGGIEFVLRTDDERAAS